MVETKKQIIKDKIVKEKHELGLLKANLERLTLDVKLKGDMIKILKELLSELKK